MARRGPRRGAAIGVPRRARFCAIIAAARTETAPRISRGTHPGESTSPGLIPASFTSTSSLPAPGRRGCRHQGRRGHRVRNLSFLEHVHAAVAIKSYCFHEPSGLDLWCRIVGARRCLAEAFGVLPQKADIGQPSSNGSAATRRPYRGRIRSAPWDLVGRDHSQVPSLI